VVLAAGSGVHAAHISAKAGKKKLFMVSPYVMEGLMPEKPG
jgi:hypothetical protein